jgi:DNA-binding LytR/AlgR family response regulator
MIRIAIVEDDESDTRIIREHIERYEQERGTKFQVEAFEDGEDIVQNYGGCFDIVLMDVEMACTDGMTAARAIREVDSEVVIIFITNMPQYAMEGYKVEALDYVLKPLSYFAFSQRIERSLTRMKRRSQSYLSIHSRGGIRKLDVSRVLYVEVQNHDAVYHTLDGPYETRDSLKNICTKLNSNAFFRCHKWFLVNLEHVDSVRNHNVHVGGNNIQVSRARRKELLDALNDYISGATK